MTERGGGEAGDSGAAEQNRHAAPCRPVISARQPAEALINSCMLQTELRERKKEGERGGEREEGREGGKEREEGRERRRERESGRERKWERGRAIERGGGVGE